MKVVIVGCGRVGSTLAENLDAAGHEVIIFDVQTSAFDRLPETFKGAAIRGDGTDEGVLRRADAEGADIFLSLTEGDNRNVMAAQVAIESFAIPRVIAKINDPVRAAAYAELGLATLCRTNLMVDTVARHLNLPMQTGPGIDVPHGSGHGHPHPSNADTPAGGEVAETAETGAVPPAQGAPAAPAAGASNKSAADEVRAQRLGSRRRG
jgi:trk system potassium uptake protein TrkA